MSSKGKSEGFSAVAIVIVAVVLVALGATGWYVSQSKNNKKETNNNTQQTNPTTSPQQNGSVAYAGWNVGSSDMAKFSIKYPKDWTFNSSLGNKDSVEHITVDNSNIHIVIDSYVGTTSTVCPDCLNTKDKKSITISGLGNAELRTINYRLDNGKGNALIITLPNASYFIPSKATSNVYTTFRAISKLNSLHEYQSETDADFVNNPGYKTAQSILESISYE
jgi:hypothetical protein